MVVVVVVVFVPSASWGGLHFVRDFPAFQRCVSGVCDVLHNCLFDAFLNVGCGWFCNYILCLLAYVCVCVGMDACANCIRIV